MSDKPTYTILIVDDSPEDRESFCRYLYEEKSCYYQILEAELISQALEICDRTLPDLILLDYLLPDEDGLVFLQEWQKRYRNSIVPVIMLTGQGNETIAVEAIKRGAQDYWVKGKLSSSVVRQRTQSVLQQLQLKRQIARQQEQQYLVNSIALRIRESLRLEQVLQRTVEEVREFLQTDRVLIYKFLPDFSGVMVAESVLPTYRVCLNLQVEDVCFGENYLQPYCQGRVFVASDIDVMELTECHREMLKDFEVRANLVVPLLLSNNKTSKTSGSISKPETEYNLWGLLIAHQCDRPRQWQNDEIDLLQQLALQLVIAIQQAEMYERVETELYQHIDAELQERQRVAAEFRALVENATDIIYRIDLEMQYLYFNPAIEKLMQQPANNLIGKTPQDLGFCSEIIALWRTTLDQIIETKTQETIEHPFPDLNSPNWFQIRIVPEFNEAGKVLSFLCIARDISKQQAALRERKKIQQQLQQLNQELEARVEQRTAELKASQRFIQSITDNTPNIIYIYDLEEQRNIYCNRGILDILGYSPGQIQAMGNSLFIHLTHPDDLDTIGAYQNNLQNLQNSEKRNCEYRMRNVNGEWRWLLSRDAVFLRNNDGTIKQIVGTAQDITERKQSEEQLRNLSERLSLAIKSGGFGIWEWDILPDRLIWDQRMYELYGLERSELPETIYQTWVNALYPLDREMAETAIQKALRGEEEYSPEFRVVHPNGSIRYIKASALIQRDNYGEPQRMIGVNFDITSAKEAEKQLRILSDRLTLAIESGRFGIWEWDIRHNTLIWDQRMRELYGVEKSPSFQTWLNSLHPDDQEFMKAVIQALDHQREVNTEFRVIHPDGSIQYIKSHALIQHNEHGEAQRMVGLNFDITSTKEAEKKLRQMNEQLTLTNAELDRATRLKDEFLANMSHELRTPLNAILGMTEGLQDGVFGNLCEQQKQAVNSIAQSGHHLLSLINDVLDLAKVESGELELQLAPVSITYLCRNSLTFVRQQALKKNIQLTTDIPEWLADIVVDELRIRQVLINLLNNAVKFTPDGGSIKLEVKAISSAPQNLLQFSVIDTGIGLTHENASKLFQPFIQIDSSLNRQYSGTGLGLALVRRLVELHQGTVEVTSELGKGSCFTVCLPYILSLAHPVKAPIFSPDPRIPEELQLSESTTISTVSHKPSRSSTILLVEDNELNITTISSYLSSKGYKIEVAKDGEEGVRLAKSLSPDLILMDIQLPKVDGLEAIRQIRTEQRLTSTPIIALTALAMTADQEKCFNAGANDYLSKPVKLKQLVNKIEHLLNLRRS